MLSRRQMLAGSAAAAAIGGGGVLTNLVSAQQPSRSTPPLLQEIQRQLRRGIQRTLAHDPRGGHELALVVRIYASVQDDAGLRATLQRAVKEKGRNAILTTEANHKEMQRIVRDLQFPAWELPPHTPPNPTLREVALDQLTTEGLGPWMRHVADAIDGAAALVEDRGSSIQRAALQVGAGDCGSCELTCGMADTAKDIAEVACAAAAVFLGTNAVANQACAAASAVWLGSLAACNLCKIAIC